MEASALLSHLKLISSLSPGLTISYTSMTVIDHNSWGTALWRRYVGETRDGTINIIKAIIKDAIASLVLSYDDTLVVAIKNALIGIATLEQTYAGDYYTIADITKIIKNTTETLDRLAQESLLSNVIPRNITQVLADTIYFEVTENTNDNKDIIKDNNKDGINEEIEYIKNGVRGRIYIHKTGVNYK